MNKPPKEQARDYVWHNYGEGDFNEHNWDRSAEEIWLAGYKAAKQWFSVNDRLPENRDIVAVWTNAGDIHAAWRKDKTWLVFNPCCTYESELQGVSHWHEIADTPEEPEV